MPRVCDWKFAATICRETHLAHERRCRARMQAIIRWATQRMLHSCWAFHSPYYCISPRTLDLQWALFLLYAWSLIRDSICMHPYLWNMSPTSPMVPTHIDALLQMFETTYLQIAAPFLIILLLSSCLAKTMHGFLYFLPKARTQASLQTKRSARLLKHYLWIVCQKYK